MVTNLFMAKVAIAATMALTVSVLGALPAFATVVNCDGGGNYTVTSGVVTTNSSCSGDLVFDASVTSIGNQAFQDNASLLSVVFPASVTSIGNDAFKNTKINSLTFNEGLTSIGSYAFADIAPSNGTRLSAVFPDTLTSLGDQAFAQSRLGHFVFGTGLTSIPSHSFYNNFGFGAQSVTFTGSITSIATAAFVGLRQEYLYLPDSITAIGERVFEGSALKIVRLPENLSSMHSTAFKSSGSIQKVVYCGNLAGVASTEGISGKPLVCGKVAEFKSNIPGEYDATYLQVASSSEALETPSFNRSGFEISAWNLQPNGLGTSYPAGSTFPFTSDTILYASWSVVVYTVSFNSSGGAAQTALNFTLGSSPLSLPTSSRTGYEFLGWFDSSQPSSLLSGSYTPASSLTLTASWSEIVQVAAQTPGETPSLSVALPQINSFSNKTVLPGDDVVVSGRRLDRVYSASLGGLNAEISLQSEGGFTLQAPASLAAGIYDLVLEAASGRITFISALRVSPPKGLVSFTLRLESDSLSDEHKEELSLISAMFAADFKRINCLVNGEDEVLASLISAQVCSMMLPDSSTSTITKQTTKANFKGNGYWVRVFIAN